MSVPQSPAQGDNGAAADELARIEYCHARGWTDGLPVVPATRALVDGMLAAADLSAARGLLSETDRQALATVIGRLGALPRVDDLPIEDILSAMRRDKKVVNGRLHFVLASGIGSTITADDVSEDELRGVLGRMGLR